MLAKMVRVLVIIYKHIGDSGPTVGLERFDAMGAKELGFIPQTWPPRPHV